MMVQVVRRLGALGRSRRRGATPDKTRAKGRETDLAVGVVRPAFGSGRLAACAAIVVAAIVAQFGLASGPGGINHVSQAEAASRQTPVRATRPPLLRVAGRRPIPSAIVVDDALAFSDPAKCISGPELERVYDELGEAMKAGRPRAPIRIAGLPADLAVNARIGTDREGASTAEGSVRLPAGATWHSLRISRITTGWYRPPEADSTYHRRITFLEPPAKVLRTLSGLGFGAKASPNYSELPDTFGGCGGVMLVEAMPGGSALRCSWGC